MKELRAGDRPYTLLKQVGKTLSGIPTALWHLIDRHDRARGRAYTQDAADKMLKAANTGWVKR